MTESHYIVTGMACGHCAASISEEVERIAGVTAVRVDVDSGRVSVSSDCDVDITDVRAAVEEAGYELAAQIRRPAQDHAS